MHRLHQGLCQFFNQDNNLPVKLVVSGSNDILKLSNTGVLSINNTPIDPEALMKRITGNKLTNIEDLIGVLENKCSILIRIKPPEAVVDNV